MALPPQEVEGSIPSSGASLIGSVAERRAVNARIIYPRTSCRIPGGVSRAEADALQTGGYRPGQTEPRLWSEGSCR